MKKRIISISAILTFMFSTQVFANEFKDISLSAAKEEIQYFSEEGYFDIFLNESSDMFYPEKAITRGEFVVLFQQVLGLEVTLENKTLPFVDIAELNDEMLGYVESAYYNGIVSGKAINNELYFSFDDELTRQEMVTIIGRFLDLTSTDPILFKDSDKVTPWAKQYVSYFYNNGITKLDENGNYNPKTTVSREEAIETLFEVKEYVNTQKDNGLVVQNYLGSGKIGYLNNTLKDSTFTAITDIDFMENGNLLVTDNLANQLRVANEEVVEVLVGKHEVYDFSGLPIGGYIDGSVDVAVLNKPYKTLVYDENTLIFTEEGTNVIRGYNIKEQKVFTVAGDVESGYKDGSNDVAMFNNPIGLAKDSKGNIYVADTLNNVIRKIDKDYNVTLYAGTPESYGNVVGDLSAAMFNEPTDLFIVDDVLYISDSGNNMIKKIENNQVSIVAGVDTYLNEETQTQMGGDRDGNVTVAKFDYPTGLFVVDDVIYVADSENNKIKTIKNGVVTTIAGTGEYGNQIGDALQATFDYPSSIVVKDGVIYVADMNNNSVKIISEKNK